jgi:hypothetical protein
MNRIRAHLAKPEPTECTNSDKWNCKYCGLTESCGALGDKRNYGKPEPVPVAWEHYALPGMYKIVSEKEADKDIQLFTKDQL